MAKEYSPEQIENIKAGIQKKWDAHLRRIDHDENGRVSKFGQRVNCHDCISFRKQLDNPKFARSKVTDNTQGRELHTKSVAPPSTKRTSFRRGR